MAPKAAGKGKAEDAPPPPPETGSGKFYFKNGATYDGEWMKVPLPKAEGTETKPADAKAAAAAAAAAAEQPDASQIMRHGNGFYADGKYKYSGSWANDKMQGTGKFTYASGSAYDGQWDNSEYHGTGTFLWPDGRKYEVWTACSVTQ